MTTRKEIEDCIESFHQAEHKKLVHAVQLLREYAETLPVAQKWQPKMGEYSVSVGIKPFHFGNPIRRDDAIVHLYRQAKLLQFVANEAPNHDPSGPGWSLNLAYGDEIVEINNTRKLRVTMPEKTARYLLELINDGQFEL